MSQNNQSIINNSLADAMKFDLQQQYTMYIEKVNDLYKEFQQIKNEGVVIGSLLTQMQNQNLLDNHITTMMNLVKNYEDNQPTFFTDETQQNLEKIQNYYNKIERICAEGLKTIFEIRKFLTGQEFIIYLEEEGKIFEFDIEHIDQHINSVIPTYTNSLDKMIQNMTKSSRAIAPELRKLGFSLKKMDEDKEIKEIAAYQEFVADYLPDVKENRKLEMAVYLYSRRPDIDFTNPSDRASVYQLISNYSKKGGLSDNITMYKLGDSIKEVENTFTNIEIKMHNGTISLTMIANGVNKLHQAFTMETLDKQREKLIKLFTVNNNKLSSVVDKKAQKNLIKKINETFAALK